MATGLLAAVAASALMGCSSSRHGHSDWDARNRDNIARGQALARQAPCTTGCNNSCQKGPNCGQYQPPAPQAPVVMQPDCDASSPLMTDPLVLNGIARLEVTQITNGRLLVVGPDGQICEVDADSKTVTTTTELPLEATVHTGGNATIRANRP